MRKIEIYNQHNRSRERVTLSELRELIKARRLQGFRGVGIEDVTPHSTSDTIQQIATRFRSWEISQFNYKMAIDIYNKGGSQFASLIQ